MIGYEHQRAQKTLFENEKCDVPYDDGFSMECYVQKIPFKTYKRLQELVHAITPTYL
jgi:hypothetical protein